MSEQLKKALLRSGKSRYEVSRDTGIPESSLSRFVQGTGLSQDAIDRLAEYLDLELKPRGEKGKRAARGGD